jgi:protein TonB
MSFTTTLLLLCFTFHGLAQNLPEKIYLSPSFSVCDSASARYFSTTEKTDVDAGIISVFSMDGIVSSRTAYRPISKKTKHGSEKSYDKQGKLQREIYYEEGKKNGLFYHYFSDSTIHIRGNYSKGLLDGKLFSFYADGKKRREDFYQNGKLISGNCFTNDGKDTNYFVFEKDAEFPGGMSELIPWIAQTIIYPPAAIEQGVQGKVYVSFLVEKDGSVSEITIDRGVSAEIDEEVKRLMQIMPAWKPAELDGRLVRSGFRLPVNFRLD